MTRFRDSFAAFSRPLIQQDFGESITYTAYGSTAETITACVRRNAEPRTDRDAQGPIPAGSAALGTRGRLRR